MDDDKAFWDWIASQGGLGNIDPTKIKYHKIVDTRGWRAETTQGTAVRKPDPAPPPEPEPMVWHYIKIPEEEDDDHDTGAGKR